MGFAEYCFLLSINITSIFLLSFTLHPSILVNQPVSLWRPPDNQTQSLVIQLASKLMQSHKLLTCRYKWYWQDTTTWGDQRWTRPLISGASLWNRCRWDRDAGTRTRSPSRRGCSRPWSGIPCWWGAPRWKWQTPPAFPGLMKLSGIWGDLCLKWCRNTARYKCQVPQWIFFQWYLS